jgi:hypothetical protein
MHRKLMYKAAELYKAMRKAAFSNWVHFQMISVLGAQKDFKALEAS